jgi:hypothetical protein
MTEAHKTRYRRWLFPGLFISRKHGDVCHLFQGNWAPIETPGGDENKDKDLG